jgi:uroporphyrinogen-III synthase
MRILLTRAKEDAERTAARLAELGHTSVVSPVIEIVPTSAAIPDASFDAVIATSAHAFSSANLRTLVHLPLYVVGERTRAAAERGGWRAAVHVGETAQALIVRLRARAGLNRALYLAGRDRKPDIEIAAKKIGLQLDLVETYVARQASILTQQAQDALRGRELDAALHYSRRSAELFIALARAAGLWSGAQKLRHFALSADVAEPLIAAGLKTVSASRPDEDHLLSLLRQTSH